MSSNITLLGVGCDEHSSFLRGSAQAPEFIRQALHSDSANAYCELGVNILHSPDSNDADIIRINSLVSLPGECHGERQAG